MKIRKYPSVLLVFIIPFLSLETVEKKREIRRVQRGEGDV